MAVKKDMMKKATKNEIKAFISKTWSELLTYSPLVKYWELKYEGETCNDNGGGFAVSFQPMTSTAILYIFKSALKETILSIPAKAFTIQALCHELGHVIIWQLEGTHEQIEKAATEVGWVIFQLRKAVEAEGLNKLNEKGKKKKKL